MQQGGLSHRLATWFLNHCPNLQLLRDVCRCVSVFLLSIIIVVLLHEAGVGTRRTGLELQVLQETKELPLGGLRKLERYQQKQKPRELLHHKGSLSKFLALKALKSLGRKFNV